MKSLQILTTYLLESSISIIMSINGEEGEEIGRRFQLRADEDNNDAEAAADSFVFDPP